jgi:hypothetical protein
MSNPLEEIYKALNIRKFINKCVSAESEDILFSKFDKCSINGYEYFDDTTKEYKRYNRDISTNFKTIYEYLLTYGYEIDDEYYDKKRYNTLCADYRFIGKGLPSIVIDFNIFHNHLFQINISYGHDSTFHDMKDYEDKIYKSLLFYAKKDNNLPLLREFKIRQLIKIK